MNQSCLSCMSCSRFWERIFGKSEKRVLIVGLDAAGKTTILYMLKLGEVITTIPTIGFNVETVDYGTVSFTCWDVGGKDKIRPFWRHYYQNTQGLVFVVDSNDRDRIDAARDELHRFMNEEELMDAALLVFANKQDLPNAMGGPEMADALALNALRPHRRRWHLQTASGVTGEGLREGLNWLAETLASPKPPAGVERAALLPPSIARISPAPIPVPVGLDTISKGVVADPPTNDDDVVETLQDRSFAVVRLEPDASSAVRRALASASAYLRRRRGETTKPSDNVLVKTHRDLETSEAHWPRDRSQLRLVERPEPVQRLASPWWRARILGSTPTPPPPHVVALREARTALALVASSLVGGWSAESLAATSTLDAFFYFDGVNNSDGTKKDGELSCAAHTDGCALTLIVSDSPGLEAMDARTGEWTALNLGDGERVAILVGRSAHAIGISQAEACAHRVRCVPRDGDSARTSISLDLHVPPGDVADFAMSVVL